jgi:hypothetical protein
MKNEDNSRVSYGRSISTRTGGHTKDPEAVIGVGGKEGYKPIENGRTKGKERRRDRVFLGVVNVFPLNKILL